MVVTRKKPHRNSNIKTKSKKVQAKNEILPENNKEDIYDEKTESKSEENLESASIKADTNDINVDESKENISEKSENDEKSKNQVHVKKNDNFFAKMKGLIWF